MQTRRSDDRPTAAPAPGADRGAIEAAVRAERTQIAAELHDTVAQSLVHLKLRLALLEDAVRTEEHARALAYCTEVRHAVSAAHSSLRRILTEFRAPLDPAGFLSALRTTASEFAVRSGIALELELPQALELAPEHARHALRIVQEALANIERHAGAGHAWIRVSTAGPAVRVQIEDDGAGLAASADAGEAHHGLAIMRGRAGLLGGRLTVGARAGGGVLIELEFPRASASEPA